MSEKIRGAIFNALGDIEGLTFLDAFAGTGAIGFEALSRGAKSVVAVDVSKEAYDSMQKSTKMLGVGNSFKAIRANVSGWCENNLREKFDIVVADPPYDDVPEKILDVLSNFVKPGGMYILSLPKSCKYVPKDLELLSKKIYDEATVSFYRV
jgi:16S rRNA (guanine966-N2)-methyltransferase